VLFSRKIDMVEVGASSKEEEEEEEEGASTRRGRTGCPLASLRSSFAEM